jgi:hypothetical protein
LQRKALAFQQQQAEEESGFSLGGFLGDVMGAGANVGSAAITGGLCCFIFLEAYNGNMPWFVRECREEFAPENSYRRDGYISMASWLVPAMQKSRIIRHIVNLLMIKPLSYWGGYYKRVQGYKRGFLFKPFVKFWFWIWERIGETISNKQLTISSRVKR